MKRETNHLEGYPIPPEKVEEMNRLYTQGQVVTTATEGSLQDLRDRLPVNCSMLDVGCGPGELLLKIGVEFPATWTCIGLDKNPYVLKWAQQKQKADHITNISFVEGDATQPLDFPDSSFDLVFARLLVGVFSKPQWLPFLKEALRILKPGGVIRLIECEWSFFSGEASEALERLVFHNNQVWARTGRSFSPNGYSLSITPLLAHLVEQAGFEHLRERAYTINYSKGQPAHVALVEDFTALFPLMREYTSKAYEMGMSDLTAKDYDELVRRALEDMVHGQDFYARSYLLQVTARKGQEVMR